MRSVRAGAHSLRSSSMSIQALCGIFLAVLSVGRCKMSFPANLLLPIVHKIFLNRSEDKFEVLEVLPISPKVAFLIQILTSFLFCDAFLRQLVLRRTTRTLWRCRQWPDPIYDRETNAYLLLLTIFSSDHNIRYARRGAERLDCMYVLDNQQPSRSVGELQDRLVGDGQLLRLIRRSSYRTLAGIRR
jgi:hypothetical protein